MAKKKLTRKSNDKHLYRYAPATPESADENDLKFQVAFSSEHPVKRSATKKQVELGACRAVGEKYFEVLSHNEGDYDLSPMNNRGALLDEHDEVLHLGSISRAEVSTDKIGRAAIVFDGITDLSVVRARQMRSGSRPHVSFGYSHTKFLGDTVLPSGEMGKRFAWEGDEISSVATPADPAAGANRSADPEMCHCLRCGGLFSREMLDDDFRCEDCGPVARSLKGKMIRAAGKEVSANDLADKVAKKALADPRFHGKNNKDEATGWVQVHDLTHDGENWTARLYCSTDGKNYSVPVNDPDGDLSLGDETEIERQGDWVPVEDMAEDGTPNGRAISDDEKLLRSADAKKPYGDVEYADSGFQADGKKRYPVNTKAHAKSAWSYINKKSNADKYSPADLAKVKSKIKAACKKFGIDCGEEDRAAEQELTRAAAPEVDLEKLVTELPPEKLNIIRKKFMAENTSKPTPELVVAALDDPTVVAALAEKGYRSKKVIEAETNDLNAKLNSRNTEIRALATEMIKDHGKRVVRRKTADGKRGEPIYMSDAIQLAMLEACATDGTKMSAEEVRMAFRSKVDDLKRDSTAEPNVFEATTAPGDVASRCDMFGGIRRMVEEAEKKGYRSTRLTPYDGAEKEADDGIRKQLMDIPGGGRLLEGASLLSPSNAPARFARNKRNNGERMTRDALAYDFATAGAFIAPEFMTYIELLRNRIVSAELGGTFIGGLGGDVIFPRQEAATQAQSIIEGGQLLPYDQVLSQIKLVPHRCGSRQYYSRLTLLQSMPDFEAFVWNDHSKVIAIYIDEMCLNGTGAADQPLGVLNQPGINQVVFGGTPTYAQLVSFRTAIRKYNVDGPIAFTTTSVGQGRMAVLPETLVGSTVISGATNAQWQGDELNGRVLQARAIASQQIPNDILLCGVFDQMLIGSWGGIVSVVDNYTRADRDEIALTLNTYFDTNVRHPQAFTRSADSVNQ